MGSIEAESSHWICSGQGFGSRTWNYQTEKQGELTTGYSNWERKVYPNAVGYGGT